MVLSLFSSIRLLLLGMCILVNNRVGGGFLFNVCRVGVVLLKLMIW